MTDWDAPIDDPTPERSSGFVWLACGLIWAFYAPLFFILPRNRKGFHSVEERNCEGADWSGEFRPGPDVLSIHNDNAGAA